MLILDKTSNQQLHSVVRVEPHLPSKSISMDLNRPFYIFYFLGSFNITACISLAVSSLSPTTASTSLFSSSPPKREIVCDMKEVGAEEEDKVAQPSTWDCYWRGPGWRGILDRSSDNKMDVYRIDWETLVKRPKCVTHLTWKENNGDHEIELTENIVLMTKGLKLDNITLRMFYKLEFVERCFEVTIQTAYMSNTSEEKIYINTSSVAKPTTMTLTTNTNKRPNSTKRINTSSTKEVKKQTVKNLNVLKFPDKIFPKKIRKPSSKSSSNAKTTLPVNIIILSISLQLLVEINYRLG